MEIGNEDWKEPGKLAKDIEELCSQCEAIGAEMAKGETISLIDGRIRRLEGLIKDRQETIKDPKINSAFSQKFRQDIKVYEYTKTELKVIEMKLLAKE
jgi:hypothetical protein